MYCSALNCSSSSASSIRFSFVMPFCAPADEVAG